MLGIVGPPMRQLCRGGFQQLKKIDAQLSQLSTSASVQDKKKTPPPVPSVHKSNWRVNVVYLYQFPRPVPKDVPNLSPYCLKLEAFLRIKGIEYQVCETLTKRSQFGKLPFVELNGEHIADSQIVAERLQKHFKCEDILTPEQAATSRALGAMIDGTLFATTNFFKFREAELFVGPAVTRWPVPAPLSTLAAKFVAGRMKRVLETRVLRAVGHLDVDKMRQLQRADLKALDATLADKPYFFGNSPVTLDCTVYGHVASAYLLPFRHPIQDDLEDEFPRLRAFIDRFHEHYFAEFAAHRPQKL